MRSLVAELRDKLKVVSGGGGEASRKRHTSRGKMLARERVDLLVDPRLAPLFAEDDVFARVISDPEEIDPEAYGYVLLNNLNLRTLRRKRELLPRLALAPASVEAPR